MRASPGGGLRHGLGVRVRQLRAALAMTQAEMSTRLGRANNNAVSRLEAEANTMIPLDLLEGLTALAEEAGHSAQWLITGQEAAFSGDPIAALAQGVAREIKARLIERLGPDFTVPMPSEMQARLDARIAEKRAAAAAPGGTQRGAGPPAPPYRPVRILEPGFEEVAAEALPEGRLDPERFVPIISGIAAGAALETTEAEQQPAGLADSFLRFEGAPPGAFALRVVGDSMAPEYQGGDLVVVDPSRRAREGVACVVYDAGDGRVGRLKRLRMRGAKAVLESANPAYPPVEIPRKKVAAAWAVAAHLPCRLERSVE